MLYILIGSTSDDETDDPIVMGVYSSHEKMTDAIAEFEKENDPLMYYSYTERELDGAADLFYVEASWPKEI